MPAYLIRIILFMVSVTFFSFVYEFNYSNKAIELTGEITSISSQSKGLEITISFQYPDQQNGLLISKVGPVIDMLTSYEVGKKIPVLYCETCYTTEKIGDTPNKYSLTLMMLLLDIIIVCVFTYTWWNGKKT